MLYKQKCISVLQKQKSQKKYSSYFSIIGVLSVHLPQSESANGCRSPSRTLSRLSTLTVPSSVCTGTQRPWSLRGALIFWRPLLLAMSARKHWPLGKASMWADPASTTRTLVSTITTRAISCKFFSLTGTPISPSSWSSPVVLTATKKNCQILLFCTLIGLD